MECTCPRCMYAFFPRLKGVDEAKAERFKDLVYAHDCTSGYWRPYPQFMCSSCGPENSETVLVSRAQIETINAERKVKRFRERDEDDIFDRELELEGVRVG